MRGEAGGSLGLERPGTSRRISSDSTFGEEAFDSELRKAGAALKCGRPQLPGARPAAVEKMEVERVQPRRLIGALVYAGLLVAVYSPFLVALMVYSTRTDLHSHVILIPFISAWMIYLKRDQLPRVYETSPGWALLVFAVGGVALFFGLMDGNRSVQQGWDFSQNDHLALMASSLVCFVWSGGFLFLGRRWMTFAAFPVVFLVFLIPLPDALVHVLERGLAVASAEAADLFFNLAGTPHLRYDLVFQLPNITIQVGQECSGIRSSWVLFITGMLASYLFLRSPWRRMGLLVLIIALGILRNGFRIFVIGLLSIEIGPHMIHSVIHRRGGPLFFALSLIPLFVLVWWMRRKERSEGAPDPVGELRGKKKGEYEV